MLRLADFGSPETNPQLTSRWLQEPKSLGAESSPLPLPLPAYQSWDAAWAGWGAAALLLFGWDQRTHLDKEAPEIHLCVCIPSFPIL